MVFGRFNERKKNVRYCDYSGAETGTTAGLRDDSGVLGVGGNARDDGMFFEDTLALAVPEEALQRSYSTSTIEHIMHQPQRTMTPTEPLKFSHRSRSSSYDDITSFSPPITPTLSQKKAQFKI